MSAKSSNRTFASGTMHSDFISPMLTVLVLQLWRSWRYLVFPLGRCGPQDSSHTKRKCRRFPGGTSRRLAYWSACALPAEVPQQSAGEIFWILDTTRELRRDERLHLHAGIYGNVPVRDERAAGDSGRRGFIIDAKL